MDFRDHRRLSFRKLRSMKVTDRHTCSVVTVQKELACTHILSQPSFFGRFGRIEALRVILERPDQREVFVRFEEEESAVRAIAWCDTQPFLFESAQHGYSKYCVRFLNGQRCDKQSCRNRHSWMHMQRTSPEPAAPAALQLQPNLFNMSPSSSSSPRAADLELQRLQVENARQASCIKRLLATVCSLKARNSLLESKVRELVTDSLDFSLPGIVDQVLGCSHGSAAADSKCNK